MHECIEIENREENGDPVWGFSSNQVGDACAIVGLTNKIMKQQPQQQNGQKAAARGK